jgi:uncharacterized membrane protein SirB2
MLKYTHVAAVIASFALFFLRGLWMMAAPEKLAARWVRVVPHVIDTVLLASAIALAVMSRQYPFVQPWLTAKILALVAYILLGSVALKRGRTRAHRVAAWLSALAVFAYIATVAVTRQPIPWIA